MPSGIGDRMPLLTIGISHHTAPIEIRERVALSPGERTGKLQSLMSVEGVEEGLLLSTCNRTELYCYGQAAEKHRLLNWIHEAWDLGGERLDEYF